MNRKEAAELLPIIQAFLEGKTIERKTRSWELNKGWRDETQWEETEELICRDTFVYRIKPESKYRPFANTEECWKEMQKHQPFGWVKRNGYYYNIVSTDITSVRIINNKGAIIIVPFINLLSSYTFVDGTQFGIKVEE